MAQRGRNATQSRRSRDGRLVQEELTGILLGGQDRAEELGKSPVQRPSCVDLSFGGSGTSRGMSSWKMKPTRWRLGPGQILCACWWGGGPIAALAACFNLSFLKVPIFRPTVCVSSFEDGSCAEEGAPNQT